MSSGEDAAAPSDAASQGDAAAPGDIGVPSDCGTDSDCPALTPVCAGGTCYVCHAGTRRCEGDNAMLCADDGGSWQLAEDCGASGTFCNALGVCEEPCGGFGKLSKTNAGCEFWAVDLHNAIESTPAKYLDAQNGQFAIVASNVSDSLTANVTVTRPDGTDQTVSLAPKTLTAFLLAPTWGLEGTQRGMNAFRLTSTAPIVAYQFNPFENEDVFSNDASLLLPVSESGTEFFAVTRAHSKLGSKEYAGYVVIIGTTGGASVTFTPTAPTAAGGDLPALSAGQPHTFTLSEGEVVAFESKSGDLTGSHVTASAPVMVFGGHVAARTGTECCSDHIEHQLPAVSRWGKSFTIGRSVPRGNESDYIRVVASKDGTNVTVDGTPVALDAGGWYEKSVDDHAVVTATQPILVAQFLASSFEASSLNMLCDTPADCGQAYTCEFACQLKSCTSNAECGAGHQCAAPLDGTPGKECKAVGDPAMIIAVPQAQWQKDFVFLTPDKYALDYINVVGPAGVTVQLDGQTLAAADWDPTGNGHVVYSGLVSDGVHVLTADSPVSLTVYGYDSAVSYGYAGAMGLKSL